MPGQILIIGGGISGTLTAIGLLRSSFSVPVHVVLLERNPLIARGPAYSTTRPEHLLNVPAVRMGLFPEDPAGFADYLRSRSIDFSDNDFMPRSLFGDYASHTLEAEMQALKNSRAKNISFEIISAEAESASRQPDGSTEVSLSNGQTLLADYIILALGNLPAPGPAVTGTKTPAGFINNPWLPNAISSVNPGHEVLILGTGLSMADMALSLLAQGHTGKITAVSSRGLMPEQHKPAKACPSFYHEIAGIQSARAIMGVLRKHLAIADSQGSDWRAVLDSLRPHTQQIWLSLPVAEKQLLLKYIRHVWSVVRHRMPPQVAAEINAMRESGQLQIEVGYLRSISATEGGKTAVLFSRASGEFTLVAHTVINCTGPESNYNKAQSPLIRSLLSEGIVRTDALNMGLDARPDGSLYNAEGQVSERCFTLGQPMRGILWECTAVPEIRVQAKALAALLSRLINKSLLLPGSAEA